MASQKAIEKRKVILRARGVPERFVDAIARRKGELSESTRTFVLMLLLYGLGGAYLFGLEAFKDALAPFLYPEAARALLIHTSNAFEGLVVLPGMTFLMLGPLWIWQLDKRRTARPFPAYDTIAHGMRELHGTETPETVKPFDDLAAWAHLPDDTAFLTALRPPWKSRKPAFFLLVLCLIPFGIAGWYFYKDARQYHSVTLEAIQVYGGEGAGTYPLADARYVDIQCVPINGGELHYVPTYAPKGFDVWTDRDSLHGLGPDQVVARLALIDKRLRDLHVPVKTLSRSGPQGDKAVACVSNWLRRTRTRDKAAVERLIFGD